MGVVWLSRKKNPDYRIRLADARLELRAIAIPWRVSVYVVRYRLDVSIASPYILVTTSQCGQEGQNLPLSVWPTVEMERTRYSSTMILNNCVNTCNVLNL